jgi:hypothetical protein
MTSCDFVSDGWNLQNGRFVRVSATDRCRKRVEELQRVLATPIEPALDVVAVETFGNRPTADQLAIVTGEVAKLPENVLRAWASLGGKVEVVAGTSVTLHPRFRGMTSTGVCQGVGIVIAADAIALLARTTRENIILHESGHAIDAVAGYVSDTDEWNRLHQQEIEYSRHLPTAQSCYELHNPSEGFAGVFSGYFTSAYTRGLLCRPVREFIERVCRRL